MNDLPHKSILSLIDSHCHLDFDVFDGDREQVLLEAFQKGVNHIVVPGVYEEQWAALELLVAKHSQLHGAVGLHPFFIKTHLNADTHSVAVTDIGNICERLHIMAKKDWVKAIGECGIDVVVAKSKNNLKLQQEIFEQHIVIANQVKKPLIIHHRKSHHLILQAFKRNNPLYGGVVHAFSGSTEDAQAYIQHGFKLGCGGTITYERAAKTRQTFTSVTMKNIVLETDSPDMPLSGYQGKRNEPSQVRLVAECLAKLKGIPLESVCVATSKNACQLFNI